LAVGYEAGDRFLPSRRPGAGASRLRSAAAARLERGTVIEAIAVTRARRLIAPRPTPVIVAIAATWGWPARVMLPGHRDPPVSPLRKGGKGLYPPFVRKGARGFRRRFAQQFPDEWKPRATPTFHLPSAAQPATSVHRFSHRASSPGPLASAVRRWRRQQRKAARSCLRRAGSRSTSCRDAGARCPGQWPGRCPDDRAWWRRTARVRVP